MRRLRYDAVAPLLAADNAALVYMARRDLPGEQIPAASLGELPGVRPILARQQPDGLGLPLTVTLSSAEPFEPDRSCPSSHQVTGIAVRALAAHRRYRSSPDTRRAAELLKSRFFLPRCLPGPGRAIVLAGLLPSLLVDRPAVGA